MLKGSATCPSPAMVLVGVSVGCFMRCFRQAYCGGKWPLNDRRFRKGVGGRGLATSRAQNTTKEYDPTIVSPFSYGGIGRRCRKEA